MSSSRTAPAIALSAATMIAMPMALGVPATALAAEGDDCDAVYVRAQELQGQRRLVAAKDALQQCINVCSSPKVADQKRDCDKWLGELAVPKVVFIATTGSGAALTDVVVSEGGQTVAAQLQGQAVEVDPGEHDFLFTIRANGVNQTQLVHSVVREVNERQEVTAVFGARPVPVVQAPPPPPAPPAPRPQVKENFVVATEGSHRTIAFQSSDNSADWELAMSDGRSICRLPCSADIWPNQGYQIRSPTRGRTTFLGSTASGNAAVVAPPTGNKGYAITTVVLSGILAGVGTYLYFAGNTQKCGYGPYKDSNGNTQYTKEVDGTCASTQAPAGYATGSGTDEGNTSSGNQKTGLILGGVGVAGLVGGIVWWVLSRSEPAVFWKDSIASTSPGLKVGWSLGPTGGVVYGSW